MKLKTAELTGPALDWAVAKCAGRALREPRRGTDEEAKDVTVPFTMYEPVATHRPDGTVAYTVQTITVTRFGVLPGCSSPTISFTDDDGRRAQGSVDLFYFDKAEAELDCQGSEFGFLDGFEPSTDWSQGGPIVEREGIGFWRTGDKRFRGQWAAAPADWMEVDIDSPEFDNLPDPNHGPTPLIAGMRCYVASKLGDEVEVPDDLVGSAA